MNWCYIKVVLLQNLDLILDDYNAKYLENSSNFQNKYLEGSSNYFCCECVLRGG